MKRTMTVMEIIAAGILAGRITEEGIRKVENTEAFKYFAYNTATGDSRMVTFTPGYENVIIELVRPMVEFNGDEIEFISKYDADDYMDNVMRNLDLKESQQEEFTNNGIAFKENLKVDKNTHTDGAPGLIIKATIESIVNLKNTIVNPIMSEVTEDEIKIFLSSRAL